MWVGIRELRPRYHPGRRVVKLRQPRDMVVYEPTNHRILDFGLDTVAATLLACRQRHRLEGGERVAKKKAKKKKKM